VGPGEDSLTGFKARVKRAAGTRRVLRFFSGDECEVVV